MTAILSQYQMVLMYILSKEVNKFLHLEMTQIFSGVLSRLKNLPYKRAPCRGQRHHSQVELSLKHISLKERRDEVPGPRPLPLRGRDPGRPSI